MGGTTVKWLLEEENNCSPSPFIIYSTSQAALIKNDKMVPKKKLF